MKLFNFEQFQFMLNQIQITQLNESASPCSRNKIKQNPYQILNQIIDRKKKSANLDFNSYNSQKQLKQYSINCQQNYPSPKNQQPIFSNTTQNIGQKVNSQSLKQSNSNKSIGAYSSRSNQHDKQQLLLQNVEQRKSIKISNSNRKNDLVGTVLNTAPCYSTVEECCDDVRDLNISYEAADETMQMRELSCSIQDDQIEEDIRQEQSNNNCNLNLKNCNNNEISSSLEQKIHSKNQLNRIEDDKNNPTIISKSNSQNQLDPLLQNLNVKKMCEVQKHYCKKRIREFRQPCEDIVQYQEFIKMINQRCSKENTTNLSSNRRIKTEYSQNSLKQKPPTASHQNQFNQSQNSINSQQNILYSNNTQHQQNFNSSFNQTCQNQYLPSFQGCQYQIVQDQIFNSNILKPKQNNNQILNTQNETTYSELNSKIFKFKKKNQPSLQENILAHQMLQQQHFSQFNSNKENNNLCDVTSQKSGIKINNDHNQSQKVNQNVSLTNQLSMIIGSRENSISNYDSRNSRSYAANSKNQQKQTPQSTVCPAIKQAQQNQLKNLPQKSQSPFYSKGSQQEREQKNIMFREQRTNSNVSYSSKNNNIFNGQQTSKSINSNNIPLKQQNPPQLNIQNPLISQRSRISTLEGYEKNLCDNLITHNNQKLSNLSIYRQNNISKSSDTTSTNHYYQNLNLITNQINFGGLAQNYNSNKNVVPFNQSYYKRQQQQQQQQQTVKFTKNLKQLNFNCLNYIRKYKEIIELQIVPFMQKIPHDDILEHQNAFQQSLLIMSDQVDISSQEDLQNFQDFLSLRSKSIYNQFLSKYGIMLQI
ncbi:hypothetical protein ABPG72_003150 [Tetrahymena utriculariae]